MVKQSLNYSLTLLVKEEEIIRLYKRFQHLDKENKGTVSVDELFAIPELAVNPLATRIVDVMDTVARKEINFKQFVSGLSVFSRGAKREDKLKCKTNVRET